MDLDSVIFTQIVLVYNEAGEKIDRAIVTDVTETDEGWYVISLHSLERVKVDHLMVRMGGAFKPRWHVIFSDPMTGDDCFSHNTPYRLVSILKERERTH